MWASFTGALKSLTPRRQRYASSEDESSPTGVGQNGAPLTVLVHCHFYESATSRDAVAEFASMLSREFAFGVDALEIQSDDPADLWKRCFLCGVVTPTRGAEAVGFDGLAAPSSFDTRDDDLPSAAADYLASLTSDATLIHRYVVNQANTVPLVHVVVFGEKSRMTSFVTALRNAQPPIPAAAKGATPRPVVVRCGLITMTYDQGTGSAGYDVNHYSPQGSDEDENDSTRDSMSIVAADFYRCFAAIYDSARNKMLALSTSRRGDSMAVAFGGDQEMSTSSLAQTSCMSLTDLHRLRTEQLKLLQIIVSNLDRLSESEQYGLLNAGSDRFHENLGRFPPVARTLRNLGFAPRTSPSSPLQNGKQLVYNDGDEHRLAQHYSNDRRRTAAALASLIAN